MRVRYQVNPRQFTENHMIYDLLLDGRFFTSFFGEENANRAAQVLNELNCYRYEDWKLLPREVRMAFVFAANTSITASTFAHCLGKPA